MCDLLIHPLSIYHPGGPPNISLVFPKGSVAFYQDGNISYTEERGRSLLLKDNHTVASSKQ